MKVCGVCLPVYGPVHMATGRNQIITGSTVGRVCAGGCAQPVFHFWKHVLYAGVCKSTAFVCKLTSGILLLCANLLWEACFRVCMQAYTWRLASVCNFTPGGSFLYANLHLVACFCMQTYTWRLVSECKLTPASLFLYANLHLEVCFCMQIYTWRLGSACKCTLGGLLL